jgi:hypothetical protein
MTEKYISIRIAPLNGRGYSGQIAHDFRSKTPAYVDREKTHLNITTDRPLSLKDRLAKQAEETGRTVRKDARVAYSGIITFSTDAQDTIRYMDTETQKQLYASVAKALSDKADAGLIYMAIHNDEGSPHAHFMLKPYTRTDRKALRLNPKDLSALQDCAGDAIAKFGLGITRGKKKASV